MTERHVVLVGLMGTGKTTVGSLLAERLGRPFVDSDHLVEARTGRTVREIWLAEGEEAFRALERDVLVEALDDPTPSVIAAAGGVVLDPANRARLGDDDCVVVWLRADATTLVPRVTSQGHRPLLDDAPAETLAAMARDRDAWYRSVADAVVDVTDLTPDEVADLAEELS